MLGPHNFTKQSLVGFKFGPAAAT